MFFMMGITPSQKQVPFTQQGVCPSCGRLARFEVWCMASCFSLFFIPVFRFGKRWVLRSSCCGAVCELPPELGKAIERGEVISLDLGALHFSGGAPQPRRCPNCGFTTVEDFQFCPHCGSRM